MSSIDGATSAGQANPDLQLAPPPNEGPNFSELKQAFSDCVANVQSITDQCQLNYATRYAIWPGQSADGKKHARSANATQVEVVPWDGASDLRIYEVDDAVNSFVALYRMAFKRATLVADPVEANDLKQAKVVSNFLRWMIHTQIPDVDREIELLANYINEKGVAAMGAFWETKQEKTLASLSFTEIQSRFPDIDMLAVMADPEGVEQVIAIFQEQYGCTKAKAKKMVKELTTTGKTTVATLGRRISRPVLRAFNLDEQLFIPPDTTDGETATGMYRVEYLTPEALRGLVNTDGWDSNWVEKAIETCRGKLIQLTPSEYLQPISRSFVYQQQRLTTKVGVVYAYQRLSDEDGVPGIYQTVFNPMLGPDSTQPGYAKYGLLEYAHGQYPFTIFRREYLSRRLHDSRGIPEPGKSWQDAVKAHVDSRVDASSIAIIPPLGFPMGRPASRWGPGARIPERRPGEYHFLDRPQADPLTEQSQALLMDSFRRYFGFQSKEGDPQDAQTKRQNYVDKFLSSLAVVFTQVWKLWAQYGDEEISFRVIGMKDATAMKMVKADAPEQINCYLTFDVQSGDMEKMAAKWKAVIDGISMLNREGNVNFAASIQAYIESIDPNLAEVILEPTSVQQEKITKEVVDDMTKIRTGFSVNVKPNTPPQLAMQVIQTWMQSQDVAQLYQTDGPFKERLDAYVKQVKFAESQEQNRLIGQRGSMTPTPAVPN